MSVCWRDGIARAPCKHEVREIPQRSVWAQSLWISRKGVVWKRVYNAISKKWNWTCGGASQGAA